MTSPLFSPFRIGKLDLQNRLVCLPLYLAYPDTDHQVNDLVLDYYAEMAASGVGMVVVENATVAPRGLCNPRTLLTSDDHADDRFVPGLARLASTIKQRGPKAVLQIHHAGRYAKRPDRIAPSVVRTWGVMPKAMDQSDIENTIAAFVTGACYAQSAGFDAVELHGGTGYLLSQFLSPRTNLRQDEYGGDADRRMRFPLEVVAEVREALGDDYPLGYRFLADEYVPGGLTLADTAPFAKQLARIGIAYLSVMAGCYDSFGLPGYLADDRREAFMVPFAHAIKQAVPATPVIAAGRIQNPATAEAILRDGKADLVGLGRVLFADPLWPRKARGEIGEPINPCQPSCTLCNRRIIEQKPAYCSCWPEKRRRQFIERVGGWEYLDVLIPAALVGATIVRIGCFVGHHHAGRLTSLPLGVAYPGGARHDLGLCEAMLLFALTLAAAAFGKHWRAIPGRTTAIGCAAYAVGRFAIEFLRGDDIELLGRHSDPRYWGLTLVQYATLGLAALALWGLWRHREHARGAAVSETTAGSTSVAATETEVVKGVKVEQASRET
jgi:2,4-dienoyl-CoA reductase (NADPH2)